MSPVIPKHILKYLKPLHIFYQKRLEEDAKTLQSVAQKILPNSRLYYSAKTNALLKILKSMLTMNYCLEIMAPGDLKSAQLAGAAGDKLLLNGMAWSKEFLCSAIYQNRIRHIHFDSIDMLDLLEAILRENPPPPQDISLGIRVHDGRSHFGFYPTPGALQAVAEKFKQLNLPLKNLHIHSNSQMGTQSMEKISADVQNNLRRLLDAQNILSSFQVNTIECFDLGGGFESPSVYRLSGRDFSDYHAARGIPSGAKLERPSLEQQFESIFKDIAAFLKRNNAGKMKIFFEPGRSIVARALSSLLEVRVVKRDYYPDAQVLITNGSTSLLGPLHSAIHPIVLLNETGAVKSEAPIKSFVYGNLPHSADWLAQNIFLPAAKVGDQILVEHTGAYVLPLEANFGYPRPGIYDAAADIIWRDPENVFDLSLRDKI